MPDPTTPALLVAHPTHLLLAAQWMTLRRPWVYVLTDGSGLDGQPTIRELLDLARARGARIGCLQGELPDAALYRQLLGGVDHVLVLGEQIVADWLENGVDWVASDRVEGFSAAHDLAGILAAACVERLKRRYGRSVPRFEMPVTELCLNARDLGPGCLVVPVEPAVHALKCAFAQRLQPDTVRRFSERHGIDILETLKTEVFLPAEGPHGLEWDGLELPQYESNAEVLRESGRIERVIRDRKHVRPRAHALWQWATEG